MTLDSTVFKDIGNVTPLRLKMYKEVYHYLFVSL